MILLLQGLDVIKDVADTQSREVTVIGLLAVCIIITAGLWYRREKHMEKRFDSRELEAQKRHEEKQASLERKHAEEIAAMNAVIADLHEELRLEIKSHSEELKQAHQRAVDMGQRAMTMIELKQAIK